MEVTRDLLSSLKYNQLRSIAAKLGIGGVGKKSDLVDKIHGVRHDRRSIELLTVELGEPLALSESDGVAEDPENRESDECVELRQEELDLLDPRRESSRVSEDEKEKLRQILREQQHNLDCPIDSDEDGEDPSIWREVQAKLPEGDSDKRTRLSQTSMQSPLDSIQKTPSVAEVDGEILSSVAKNLQKNFRFGSAGDVVEDVALVQEQSRIEDFYQSPTEIDDDCSCSLSAHEESASQRSATSRGSTARNLSRSNDPLSGSKTLFDELDRVHANLNVENAKSTHGERQSSAEAVSDFAKGEDATVTSTLQSKQETPSSIEVNLTETVSQPDLGSPEWINDKDTLGPLPTIASARKSSLGSGDGVSVNKLSVMLSSMQVRLLLMVLVQPIFLHFSYV